MVAAAWAWDSTVDAAEYWHFRDQVLAKVTDREGGSRDWANFDVVVDVVVAAVDSRSAVHNTPVVADTHKQPLKKLRPR